MHIQVHKQSQSEEVWSVPALMRAEKDLNTVNLLLSWNLSWCTHAQTRKMY